LQPTHTFGLGALASHGVCHAGGDIGTGILDSTAKSRFFTPARDSLAVKPPIEEHADLHPVTRAAKGGVGDEGCNASYKESHNDSEFQIRPR
jgi:hypothetical protein